VDAKSASQGFVTWTELVGNQGYHTGLDFDKTYTNRTTDHKYLGLLGNNTIITLDKPHTHPSILRQVREVCTRKHLAKYVRRTTSPWANKWLHMRSPTGK
jgi:hypothetical protein